MTKKYKTTNELIEILEPKNVSINDKEKAIYINLNLKKVGIFCFLNLIEK